MLVTLLPLLLVPHLHEEDTELPSLKNNWRSWRRLLLRATIRIFTAGRSWPGAPS
ncbi:hypothetical protein D910_11122 [Dendroctonus ponderosae]|uniref:Uncharacterized protein n=1 Tax=Dendroctonus ponderosae TaxID=77166 RepID=U4UUI8_DENPD|nr:hypothetical protein D910_11122 [Dendroctonus ponderosae]